MAKNSGIAIGAIIGAAAGFVAGILTAPKSGKETREDIKIKAVELKDGAEKVVTDVKDKAVSTFDSVKKDAEKAVDDTKHRFWK